MKHLILLLSTEPHWFWDNKLLFFLGAVAFIAAVIWYYRAVWKQDKTNFN